MRGWDWPITANWRIQEMQGRAYVAPVRFFEWFLHKRCRLRRPLIKKKKNEQTKNNLTFSETGCDWLDPTLEHNVVPVLSSQWLSDCLSGQERDTLKKKLTTTEGEATNDQ